MILVILLGLLIPFPLALHCLFLVTLNRRSHPVLVWGLWDFAEVLFATSGFLLFGGPCILAGFNQNYRDYLLLGPLRPAPRLTTAGSYLWLGIWVGYFTAVVGVAAVMLWRRRRATSIYNVEPQAFHERLAAVLDRLKLDWVRSPDCVYVGYSDRAAAADAVKSADADYKAGLNEDSPRPRGGQKFSDPDGYAPRLAVRVDVFPAMRHVSLYWPAGAGLLRQEIESGLANEFTHVTTRHNPVSTWLLSVAICLFVIMTFTVLFLAFVAYYMMKRAY